MKTAIVAHPDFDRIWPFSADRLHQLLAAMTDVSFVRVPDGESSLAEVVADPASIERLISLGLPLQESDLDAFPALVEAMVTTGYSHDRAKDLLESRGVRMLTQPSEGFWGQSVSEFALGLTLGTLRRIRRHTTRFSRARTRGTTRASSTATTPASRTEPSRASAAAHRRRGQHREPLRELHDDARRGCRRRDPYASEPSFHRAGSRREYSLDRLVEDAEIFVPMVPLMPSTTGLVTAAHLAALPTGTLVVLATRAGIVDVPELRRRVLADELSLAADVFDEEQPSTIPCWGATMSCTHRTTRAARRSRTSAGPSCSPSSFPSSTARSSRPCRACSSYSSRVLRESQRARQRLGRDAYRLELANCPVRANPGGGGGGGGGGQTCGALRGASHVLAVGDHARVTVDAHGVCDVYSVGDT